MSGDRHCEERLVRRRSSTSEGGSDEAIQLSLRLTKAGLLRGACHRAALCADPLARNDGLNVRITFITQHCAA
jgi:hypothetical protein